MPFVQGFLYGIATLFLVGPVFFTLLRGSLQQGFRGGVLVALGIIVSDIVIVAICLSDLFQGLANWVEGPLAALAGAVVLFVLGSSYLVRSPAVGIDQSHVHRSSLYRLFVDGFLVNFVNPAVFAIWIALTISAKATYGEGTAHLIMLLGTLTGILLTDLGKAALAPMLKKLLNPHFMRRVNVALAVMLLLFSLRLFIQAWSRWV